MTYTLMDSIRNGDLFTQDFNCLQAAIDTANRDWNRLSQYDKDRRGYFIVIDEIGNIKYELK